MMLYVTCNVIEFKWSEIIKCYEMSLLFCMFINQSALSKRIVAV